MNYYINNDWYMYGNINENTKRNKLNLYSPDEAYLKGNLFRSLYSPYKNYQPAQLKPTSEKEKLLRKMV